MYVVCQQSWTDWRLAWNMSEFDNFTDVSIKAEKIWRPDAVLLNKYDVLVQSSTVYACSTVFQSQDIIK